jgi:hypothetical protein
MRSPRLKNFYLMGAFNEKFSEILLYFYRFNCKFSFADPTWFTTIPQAEKYCPALNGLNYNAITQFKGTVTGNYADRNFISYNANNKTNLTMRPKNISPNDNSGPVQNASFRFAMQGYGYITDNQKIACFYSYPGYTGVKVALLMISG